jgi:hypothetical protein
MLAGDRDGAERQLAQTLQIVTAHRQRIYLPQPHLTETAIAGARGQPAAALASVRSAIEAARAQQAAWLELLAPVELCAHDSATARDHQALAVLFDRLLEGADTDAVTRALALIRGGARAAATWCSTARSDREGTAPGPVHVISATQTCATCQPWHDKGSSKTSPRPGVLPSALLRGRLVA